MNAFFSKKPLYVILFLCISFWMYAQKVSNTPPAESSGIQKAHWIYYPGDFEIYMHNKLHLQRTERNQSYPPLWRLDAPYSVIDFVKNITLTKPEFVSLSVDGNYFVLLNGNVLYDFDPTHFLLPEGANTIQIRVSNTETVPSILFESKSAPSDESWSVIYDGAAVPSACYKSSSPNDPPSGFKLATQHVKPVCIHNGNDYQLYDFGKNTFGFPVIESIKGKGAIAIYYGESKEEAMAEKLAETWDIQKYNNLSVQNDTLKTKAFRFVKVVTDPTVRYEGFSALYEYLPVNYRGYFKCPDSLLNQIYETALYTFHLNTRECHLDGIKRDRWVWSGDALQSYWMNFYSFFDEDVNKRTLWGLRGHSPINRHINTILDYSFYWLIGIDEHFQHTADTSFVRQIYPRMKETFDFINKRLDENGRVAGKQGDWVFVDWAPINKEGVLSFEQLLYLKSLQCMANCAAIAGDRDQEKELSDRFIAAKNDFDALFWSTQKNVYVHQLKESGLSPDITRYANMFAVLFNFADPKQKEHIKENVLLNPDVLQITTPYMKFYELAALCETGEHQTVLNYVRSYWGDMLRLGATTFWEAYDPAAPIEDHYKMYGRPFGKSLCHAWGANPIYLFGKYYLGVSPLEAGYQRYQIKPELAGLEWIEGAVPTPHGDIKIHLTKKRLQIETCTEGVGEVVLQSASKPRCKDAIIESVGNNQYRIIIDKPNYTYVINYQYI